MPFVEKYVAYCKEFTDAPEKFHRFLAYFIMATLIGKKCSLDFGQNGLYPCLWIILVAPSGLFRKSTSLGIAKSIIQSVDPLVIFPTSFSGEALFEKLDQQATGALIYGEFDRFAGMLTKDYMSGTTAMLTEVFDCPPSMPRVTISKKTTIIDPFINIAAGSTTHWLFKRMSEEDIIGGFLPRFLMVYENDLGNIKSVQPPDDQNKFNELIRILQKIRIIKSSFRYSKEAFRFYDHWYLPFVRRGMEIDSRLDPFVVRITDYAHKLALLDHIDLHGDLESEIGIDSVKKACALVEESFYGVKSVIVDQRTSTHYQANRKRVINFLMRRKGNVFKGDILRGLQIEAFKLNAILDTLIEEGTVETESRQGKVGRPAVYVKLNKETVASTKI